MFLWFDYSSYRSLAFCSWICKIEQCSNKDPLSWTIWYLRTSHTRVTIRINKYWVSFAVEVPLIVLNVKRKKLAQTFKYFNYRLRYSMLTIKILSLSCRLQSMDEDKSTKSQNLCPKLVEVKPKSKNKLFLYVLVPFMLLNVSDWTFCISYLI